MGSFTFALLAQSFQIDACWTHGFLLAELCLLLIGNRWVIQLSLLVLECALHLAGVRQLRLGMQPLAIQDPCFVGVARWIWMLRQIGTLGKVWKLIIMRLEHHHVGMPLIIYILHIILLLVHRISSLVAFASFEILILICSNLAWLWSLLNLLAVGRSVMRLEIQDIIMLCYQLPLSSMWLHRVAVRVVTHHEGLHLKARGALRLAGELRMLSLVCLRLHARRIQVHRLWLRIVAHLVRTDEFARRLWFVLIHDELF